MRKRTAIRCALIALSVLLGAVLHFGTVDSSEAQYVALFQRAVLQANAMWFFVIYAHIGDSIIWIGSVLLLLAYDFRRPRKALKLLLFLALAALGVLLLRYTFPRERPFQAFPLQVQVYAYEGIPSYPSGHVAPAAGGFYLLAGHSRKLNAVFGALVVLLALSRVATGTHFFTDTIGAALLSYPLAAIIDDLDWFRRFKARPSGRPPKNDSSSIHHP